MDILEKVSYNSPLGLAKPKGVGVCGFPILSRRKLVDGRASCGVASVPANKPFYGEIPKLVKGRVC